MLRAVEQAHPAGPPDHSTLHRLGERLCTCLATNTLFDPEPV